MLPFSVRRVSEAAVDVVEAAGEVDWATISELAPAYDQCLSDGSGTVIADYSRVTFIDSMAIGQLIHVQNHLAEADRQLLIVSGLHKVRRVLAIVDLGRVIPIFDRLGDAKRHAAALQADRQP